MIDFILEILADLFGQGVKKINFTKIMTYFIGILLVITIISWIIALASL